MGGAHGERPLRTMNGYLDDLDAADPPVPVDRRVLSALGPRMLELSRDRAAGALPLLVTPEFTARARRILGPDSALVVMEYVVLEEDPQVARDAVREPVGFLARVGGYRQNLRRMGFTDEDIAGTSDRLIDGLVVLVVQPTRPDAAPHAEWRAPAEALIG